MGDRYPIAVLKHEEGIDDQKEVEECRFGRNGYQLIAPFQCDLCHFCDIQLRDPRVNSKLDKKLLVVIRDANLSGNPVASNLGDVKKILIIVEKESGIMNIFPEMGSHPLEDQWGMGIACCILQKTLDKGDYGPNMQLKTARKLRSGYSNVWGASINTLARDTMKMYLTNCHTVYGLNISLMNVFSNGQ